MVKCNHDNGYYPEVKVNWYDDIFCNDCDEELCECIDFTEIHLMEAHRYDHDW